MRFRDDDDAFDHSRQREIDEAADAERALFAGKEAGRAGAGPEANPHEEGSPEHASWERGRAEEARVAA